MKKSLLTLSLIALTLFAKLSAQCPTPTGMVATQLNLNGYCFVNIQNAIPGSNVSIYNAAGYVAQGTANAGGQVVIPYNCSVGALTSVVSATAPPLRICSQVTIATPIPLPIKLVSFTTKFNANKKPVLEWKTAYEISSEKIELQKSSDGRSFTTISTFATDETSLSEKTYTHEDADFTAGSTAYYRIKQTDLDGKLFYSKVVYVSDKSSSDISVFPNPVKAGGQIFLKGVKAADVQARNIRVSDIAGRNVEFTVNGTNSIQLSEKSPRGIYIVRINDKSLKVFVE